MNENNVFINCPFDNHYFTLLKPLLFSIIYMDLTPKISETSDSGIVRLYKIKEMIFSSKYSIHDLSRIEPLDKDDLPRFNMPFECGIDFGIRLSNPDMDRNKRILIMEKEPYRYQKVLSDISGNDIKAHNEDPQMLIKIVRDWFKPNIKGIPGYNQVWLAYCEFEFDYEKILKGENCDPRDINALTFSDIIEIMQEWILNYKKN